MHDVVTVMRAAHVAPAGLASAEYSWFPGYAWTILMCSRLTIHMHDVVTVTRAAHVAPAGFASAEYSWFPGYAWTILMCSRCMAHVGWR
ncbi:putative cereblon [Operophtera brumata]|uniref:Putative cereblon n=1 Tax=Operophtera brumata TaxID=104452 RepID=A0A0L7KUW6_OPEBR|nr:putative cereblon [Operophtera brumata]